MAIAGTVVVVSYLWYKPEQYVASVDILFTMAIAGTVVIVSYLWYKPEQYVASVNILLTMAIAGTVVIASYMWYETEQYVASVNILLTMAIDSTVVIVSYLWYKPEQYFNAVWFSVITMHILSLTCVLCTSLHKDWHFKKMCVYTLCCQLISFEYATKMEKGVLLCHGHLRRIKLKHVSVSLFIELKRM